MLTRRSNRTKGAVTFFAKTRKKTARTFCRLAWRYVSGVICGNS
jgi:hypothetical protein